MSKAKSVRQAGPRRYIGLIAPMLISIICMGVLFAWVAIQTKHEQQYAQYSARLKLLSQTITKYALEASQGKGDNKFNYLKQEGAGFEQTFGILLNGGTSTLLPAAQKNDDGTYAIEPLNDINKLWPKYRKSIAEILKHRDSVKAVNKSVDEINKIIPEYSEKSYEILEIIVENTSNPVLVQKAGEQLFILERIKANVNVILNPQITTGKKGKGKLSTTASDSAVDRFSRDAVILRDGLNVLLHGNKVAGIAKIRDKEARTILQQLQKNFDKIGSYVSKLKKEYTKLSKVQKAANQISRDSEKLYGYTTELASHFDSKANVTFVLNLAAFGFGAVALLLLGLLGFRLVRDAGSRTKVAESQNREQQEAILRLLDEIQGLSEGDLTAQAVVTEDFTGAIADAFNSSIEELRKLVATINETSVQVSSAAQETQATAMHLAEASDHQEKQITSVSQAINDMASSIEEVSKNAAESSKVAQNSVRIAHAGVATVRRNIQGMDSIREQIQETSKRIKRLGESSQEIGDIIELINDIADQTNILSLNAAIQAAMAGEAGRGFAVVADEVQRLAERSSNATKQIEALVKTIQTDTNEAVISMEQSTAGVVKGAKMAEDAGEALAEIESVSNRLAELIQNISENASQQSNVATSVSETMKVIQEITTQTSAGTNETAASIGNLAELANDLRKSVSGFKLPDDMKG